MKMKSVCAVMLLFGLSTLIPAIPGTVTASAHPLEQANIEANNGGQHHPHIRAAIHESAGGQART